MAKKETEYISLKEASKMSGYASDYLGQLIRSGKLEGKQVFSSVSWVTTREALEEYMEKGSRVSQTDSPFTLMREWLASVHGVSALLQIVLWMCLCILSVFILFLVYVFAVSVDHVIEERYLNAEARL